MTAFILFWGLDDYRKGFQRFPDRIDEVDKIFGTKLAKLSVANEGTMTFTETILGTAVMTSRSTQIDVVARAF